MKKLTLAISLMILTGCQASDQEIRADIAVKARQDLNFSGLNYTVKNGVVNFTGRCPSEKAFAQIQQTVKNIQVIKAVHYNVFIMPITLDSLTNVKLLADSILAKYPQVIAEVKPGGVTLKGTTNAAKKAGLINDFTAKHIGPLKDSLLIR